MPQMATASPRMVAVDLARTAAIAGMVVFHTGFDLQMFGYLPQGTVFSGPWPILARAVAGSFLFLAGVSLYLAHAGGIRWRAFARRFCIVAAAAGLVTVGTYFGVGDAFVRFGILHCIALSTLIGLAFLRVPVVLTFACAIAVVMAPAYLPPGTITGAWMIWLARTDTMPFMVDYEPLIPWLGPCLAGIATARLADHAGLWRRLRALPAPGRLARLLAVPGRHSLLVYLIHQPVIFGTIWTYAMLTR